MGLWRHFSPQYDPQDVCRSCGAFQHTVRRDSPLLTHPSTTASAQCGWTNESWTPTRSRGHSVLFLDVDDFKTVNDTLGHAAGDRLLVDLASRLRAALRTGDSAARVGGDEFLVHLDDVATKEAALVVAGRLSEALRLPYEIGTDRRIATASIGVAVGPDGLGTADDVVAAADAAMYDAKRRGGGRCVLYSEDLHRRGRRRPPGEPIDGSSIAGDPGQGLRSRP